MRLFEVTPEDAGLSRCSPQALAGGDAQDNARILSDILSGADVGPRRAVVVLNAAAALVVADLAPDLAAGAERARAAIDRGAAAAVLCGLVQASA